MALAPPTILGVNMLLVQYWVLTKEARLKPIRQRQATNSGKVVTHVIAKHGSDTSSMRMPYARRGPI